MTMVSVSGLRANLSRCLREAHLGGEIQVFDWVVPVADWCRLKPPPVQIGSRAGLARNP